MARRGKILTEKAYGVADREKNIAATTDTQYRIGSMNKMFTSVAALQLVEAGKLKLDEMSGGRLNVNLLPAGSVVGALELQDAVLKERTRRTKRTKLGTKSAQAGSRSTRRSSPRA